MTFSHSLIGAALGVLLASGAALAQEAPAPAAPAGRPDVKTIGDWLVRCFPITSPSPCDMFQELEDQRTRQRILSFSIAHVPSLNRDGIQIGVPLEVSIPRGLFIVAGNYTSPNLKFRYCDRNGCFVQVPLDTPAIAALSKAGDEGKVRIFADGGKQYELRFSLKGFSAAHDDMVTQAKAKAKTPAPAAPAPAQ
jgi:invasion protein IalB